MCHTIITIIHRNNLHVLEKNIISETSTPITTYFRTRKFDTIIYHNINNNIHRRRRRTFQTSEKCRLHVVETNNYYYRTRRSGSFPRTPKITT